MTRPVFPDYSGRSRGHRPPRSESQSPPVLPSADATRTDVAIPAPCLLLPSGLEGTVEPQEAFHGTIRRVHLASGGKKATDILDRALTRSAALLSWREEADEEHRLEGIQVQPLRDPHVPEELPRRVLVVSAGRTARSPGYPRSRVVDQSVVDIAWMGAGRLPFAAERNPTLPGSPPERSTVGDRRSCRRSARTRRYYRPRDTRNHQSTPRPAAPSYSRAHLPTLAYTCLHPPTPARNQPAPLTSSKLEACCPSPQHSRFACQVLSITPASVTPSQVIDRARGHDGRARTPRGERASKDPARGRRLQDDPISRGENPGTPAHAGRPPPPLETPLGTEGATSAGRDRGRGRWRRHTDGDDEGLTWPAPPAPSTDRSTGDGRSSGTRRFPAGRAAEACPGISGTPPDAKAKKGRFRC